MALSFPDFKGQATMAPPSFSLARSCAEAGGGGVLDGNRKGTKIKAMVEKPIADALFQYAVRCTIPLLCEHADNLYQVGTCTLFSFNDATFLVTARHHFDECDPGQFLVPKALRGWDLQSLDGAKLYKPNISAIDIAVLHLPEPSARQMKKGWRSLTSTSLENASSAGVFILSAYPSALVQRDGNRLRGGLLMAWSERCQSTPGDAKDVYASLDLFFHYDPKATGIDGANIDTPDLRGASGAPVWEYFEPADTAIWIAEKTLKLVGVQSAWMQGEYFRAKSSDYLRDMFQRIQRGELGQSR